MDENNGMEKGTEFAGAGDPVGSEQETGFIMMDSPAGASEPEQGAEQDQPGQDAWQMQQDQPGRDAEQAQQDQPGRDAWQMQQDQPGRDAWQAQQDAPGPLPSSDNTYRFQNMEMQYRKEKKRKEPRKGMSFARVAALAVLFGIIASASFWGVQTLFSAVGGGSKAIPEVETKRGGVVLNAATGAAVSVSDVSGIVEKVMPSIVAITEKSTQTSYFGRSYPTEGAGSGFIVKQDNDQLLVVTNNHVVANADQISVTFNDNEVAEAAVKGTSESNDLAVLTVKLGSLKESTKRSIRVASLGSSDHAKVGQMVIAIGNALGYGQSVTVGYLSAKNREVQAEDNNGGGTTQILMQTDAAINPGNSGGALIDTNGNVIGINSSKYFSFGSTNVEGMGYAIPMSDAISVINDLMDREVLKDNEKGYLGITGRNISDSVSESYGIPTGVYVAAVSDTGAAYKAGIKQGDVITKIDGATVKSIEQVQEKVNSTKAGTSIRVTIQRSNDGRYSEKEVKVTLQGKDTLDGLPQEEQQPYSRQNYNEYDQDSEIMPWGSIY